MQFGGATQILPETEWYSARFSSNSPDVSTATKSMYLRGHPVSSTHVRLLRSKSPFRADRNPTPAQLDRLRQLRPPNRRPRRRHSPIPPRAPPAHPWNPLDDPG